MKNKRFYSYFCMYLGLILYAGPLCADVRSGPYVAAGSCTGVQEEVVAFAKKAYDSPIFNLSDYNSLEKVFAEIGSTSSEIMFLSSDLIEKKEAGTSQFSVEFSWPKQMLNLPKTFVKMQRPFNWQGDWYALYWVPTTKLSDMVNEAQEILKEKDDLHYKVLKKDLWQQPFFIYVKNKKEIVGVIPGPLYSPISEWNLYVPTRNGELSTCQIKFYLKTDELNLRNAKRQVSHVVSQLFPRKGALCSLVKILDDMLGPGANEGTLQPTAGIRVHVCQLIVNIALRPWVIESIDKEFGIKEKAHVDKNLEKWALKNKTFLKQYQEMRRLYPLAEKELKDYYQMRFGKTADQAESLAKESLEMLYISFFHFPSD